MKTVFTRIVFAVTTLSTLVSSQSVNDLPSCAASCAPDAPAGCSSSDLTCICKSTSYLQNAACCVLSSCSSSDAQQTFQLITQLCAAVQVTLPTTLTSCGSSASTAAPAASSVRSSAVPQVSSAASTSAAAQGSPATQTASPSSVTDGFAVGGPVQATFGQAGGGMATSRPASANGAQRPNGMGERISILGFVVAAGALL